MSISPLQPGALQTDRDGQSVCDSQPGMRFCLAWRLSFGNYFESKFPIWCLSGKPITFFPSRPWELRTSKVIEGARFVVVKDGPRHNSSSHRVNANQDMRTGGPGTYVLTGVGCLQGGAGTTGNLAGYHYKTPYAIHMTGGVGVQRTSLSRKGGRPQCVRKPTSAPFDRCAPLSPRRLAQKECSRSSPRCRREGYRWGMWSEPHSTA